MAAPSITIFVRHSADCTNRLEGEFFKRCNCRKHLRWFHNGNQHRQSAKTRSWAQAEVERRKLEARFNEGISEPTVAASDRKTLEQAIKLFITDKKSQGLSTGVVKKYERELARFEKFMGNRGKLFPADSDLETLTEYRATWGEDYSSSTTRQKVQERLRSFLRYCFEAGWLARVPKLSPIKVNEPPTMPMSDTEYNKLLDTIPVVFKDEGKMEKTHALLQLMRHSGLAIRDSVTLEKDELRWDGKRKIYRITTNRQKTGTHVSVPIPEDVAKEILTVLNGNPKYVFWNRGLGKEETVVTNWQNKLRVLFTAAGLSQYTPHCLRDTFAVDLLQKGVPLEEVSKLLGHESIKTTERSYSPWVQKRQDRLDDLVTATWKK